MNTREITGAAVVDDLTPDERDRVVRRAMAWVATWLPRLVRNLDHHTVPMCLAAALTSLSDGRRYAIRALESARDQISATGPRDDVHQSRLAEIDYAVARLSGALGRRLDPELLEAPGRAAVAMRAHDLATVAVADLSDDTDLATLTDVQCLSVAYGLVTERLVALSARPRRTQCTWCVGALGRDAAQVVSDPAEMTRHALECPHSPGAAAIRALRRMSQLDGASTRQEQLQTLRAGVFEVENLRLAAATREHHEREPLEYRSDPTSPVERIDELHTTTPAGSVVLRSVEGCQRCGGDHDELVARPFQRPVDVPEAGGVLWTHHATCPTSGDPILIVTSDAPIVGLTPDVVEGLKRFADVAAGEGQVFPNPPLTGDRTVELAAVAWLESRGWRRDE